MGDNFCHGCPIRGLGDEDPVEEVLCIVTDPRRAAELAAPDAPEQLLLVAILKREKSGEKYEEDDATRPYVGGPPVIALAAQDLGGDVVRGPTGRVQQVSIAAGQGAQPEV